MGGVHSDWQGHRQAIVTLTDRKSRFVLLRKVVRRTAYQMSGAVIGVHKPIMDRLHTLTADNGNEFTEPERITQELQADLYFAHPYTAWERGANKNMNGLIRQYIPKKYDLASVSDVDVALIMNRQNHRPRKCLEFLSPIEIFLDQSVVLTS